MKTIKGFSFETVELTGGDALKLLDADKVEHHNRPVHQSKVDDFKMLILSDEFRLTPDPIVIEEDSDTILNGQHRLLGLWMASEVEPGVTAQFVITRGWPRGVQFVLDVGLKRTLRDAIVLEDSAMDGVLTNRHMSTARYMYLYNYSVHQQTFSREKLKDFTKRYLDGVEFAIREVLPFKDKGIRAAPVSAAVAMCYYHVGADRRDELIRFGRIVAGRDMPRGDADRAAHLFRNFLLSATNAGSGSTARVIFNKASNALEKFLKQEPIAVLYEAKQIVFPLTSDAERAKPRGRIEVKRSKK